jgi:hypothetical protein
VPKNGKCWYILRPFGINYGHLKNKIKYKIWPFGVVCGPLVYYPVLVCLGQKNLATLILLANPLFQELDDCVEIPQSGVVRSLNVHVSGALVVWEYVRQALARCRFYESLFRTNVSKHKKLNCV